MSNLDVWSCSVTFYETLSVPYVALLWGTKLSLAASWLTGLITHTLKLVLKEQLQPKTVSPLPPFFHWRSIHMDYKDCFETRLLKIDPMEQMPPYAWVPWCQSKQWPFNLTYPLCHSFTFCLYIPLPVLSWPLSPLRCSSPQSLTGDSRM